MNKKLSLHFIGACLLSIPYIHAMNYCCNKSYAYGKTHFSQRPQGNNQAIVFVGTADKTHLLDNDINYLNLNISVGYRQNFDACDLGKYFFTERGTLIVGERNTTIDVRNLELGLAANFKGAATLEPKIHEFYADFDIYCGFDEWLRGSWFRIRLPFVHTEWTPCLRTINNEVGAATYPSGLNVVYRRLEDALCDGKRIAIIREREAGNINCNKKRYGLSGIHLEFGYDFFRRERGNIGIALLVTPSTGTPTATTCNQFLFSPSIGSQRCSQVGVALRGQYEFFNNSAENKILTLYSDLRTVHLFSGCTRRLLSLCAGGTSAFNYWLLLNRYNEHGTFLGIEYAANLLNKRVKVSNAAMIEWTLMTQMHKDNWDLSFGYDFWYRSKECVCPTDKCLGNGADFYAIKDTARTDTSLSGDTFLNKNLANIQKQPVASIVTNSIDHLNSYAFLPGDIDVCVAQHPETYSNMLFAAITYNFGRTWLKPYLSLMGQAEFGCGNLALSMWGIYLKGGISF